MYKQVYDFWVEILWTMYSWIANTLGFSALWQKLWDELEDRISTISISINNPTQWE